MEASIFDIVIASFVLIVGIKGIFRGLIKELAGLLGLVAGVYLASTFARNIGGWIDQEVVAIQNSSAISLLGFLAVLITVWVGFMTLGWLISTLVKMTGLGLVDKVLGFIFAGGKVFVIIAVIVYALSSIEIVRKNTQDYLDQSLLYPPLMATAQALMRFDLEENLEKAGAVTKKGTESLNTALEEVKTVLEEPLKGE